MKFTLAALALAISGASAALIINTPVSAVVCKPLLITWSGGYAPFFLVVVPGNNPSGPALRNFGAQPGHSFTWVVNEPAGTSVGLLLKDSTGAIAQSAPFTIQPSSDTSCL
ncbi:hypothetical protein BDQ12DRAFT_634245 [Crucibulum laeve]|uniref:Ser-Thr-rich glycosyl-phosphatidyl-inositol-anchored membrane family-domain-containing protein n=1 Tax=Crucibulum laeve TaxID=68775 RepID=A0A5C3LUJ3_9AGAR|nr:hypothetical protein BDQ12DRAFT_634245 [Crucibulum laeve]